MNNYLGQKISNAKNIDINLVKKMNNIFVPINIQNINFDISYQSTNIENLFVYDTDAEKITTMNIHKFSWPLQSYNKPLYSIISSDLFLRCLMTIFSPDCFTSKDIGSRWNLTLMHNLTKNIITFYDKDKSFWISSKFIDVTEIPKLLIDDLNELLNTICNCEIIFLYQ